MLDKLTNHFLVATPSVDKSLFYGSLVYITEHTVNNGAVGVIVNKPIGRTLKDAFQNLDLSMYNPSWNQTQLYLGGPIKADNGFVLHRPTSETSDKLFYLSNNRDVLSEIANSKFKDDLFIAVGYSVWSSLQLEKEIVRNDWLVVKADAGLVFDVDPVNRHSEAMRLLGVNNLGKLYLGSDIIA